MRVIREGHVYELKKVKNKDPYLMGVLLQFIHKEPIAEGSTELKILGEDGTTDEEVFEAMIDRMKYLQKKSPCIEYSVITTRLEGALVMLKSLSNSDLIK